MPLLRMKTIFTISMSTFGIAHLTMRTHGVNQAFGYIERVIKSGIFTREVPFSFMRAQLNTAKLNLLTELNRFSFCIYKRSLLFRCTMLLFPHFYFL